MRKLKREWIVFILGSIIQAASFGFFLGGLKQEIRDVHADVEKLTERFDGFIASKFAER